MKNRTYCSTCAGVTECRPIFLADPYVQRRISWMRWGSLCLQCGHTSAPLKLDVEKLPGLLQRPEGVIAVLLEPNWGRTMIATRRCGRCGQDKPLTAFYLHGSGKSAGRPYGYCKECRYQKEARL